MFHRYLAKAYIVAIIIMVLCLLPGSALPSADIQWVSFDKFVHVVMYVFLVWTLVYGFRKQERISVLRQKFVFIAFFIASLYGAMIEVLQYVITPDRAAELWDLVADIVGVMLGLLTYPIGEKLIQYWNKLFRKV